MWNTAQNHQCVRCLSFILKTEMWITVCACSRACNHHWHLLHLIFPEPPTLALWRTSLTYWETLFSHTQAFLQVNLIHSIMAENVITYLKSSSASPESLSSPSVGHKQQGHQHVNILVPFKQEHHSMGKTAAFKHLKNVHYYALLHFNTCCLRPIRSWASEIPAQAKDMFSVSESSEALMAEVRIQNQVKYKT